MANPKRILVVDDDESSRKILGAKLKNLGHEVEHAKDGFEALAVLKMGFDLMMLDVVMPGMDGFDIIKELRRNREHGDIPVCLVTSYDTKDERLQGVRAGANDFIAKPVDNTELEVRVESLLKMKDAQDAVKRHQAKLEEAVVTRTADLRRALEEMSEAQRGTYRAHLETIDRLALASEYRDDDTGEHIRRLGRCCELLAWKVGQPPSKCEILRYASLMHDVGKIGISDTILLKPGKLTESEWEIVKEHTNIGARMLSGATCDVLQAGATIALTHHEKWDGGGYPQGLAGEDIPLYGRIVAVADVFDALTHDRPYKKAFPKAEAIEMMVKERGTHFDPTILDLFAGNVDQVDSFHP